MRSRLLTLRTNTADLVSSFFSANKMVVNLVLGIDILLDAPDPGAAFDFQGHYDCRCFPGTWEQYIAEITIRSAKPASSMRGPAGVGKLAIAPTCADKLKETGHLDGAFFFSVKKYDNPSHLFTTIAYQLATALPDYRSSIDGRRSERTRHSLRRRYHLNLDH